MELIFLEKTKQDFLWVRKYYEQIFPEGVNNALSQFDLMEELILNNPYIGRKSMMM